MRAVQVALARHHQVLVICPWPPGVPAPGGRPEAVGKATDDDVALVRRATTERLHQAFGRLRQVLARLGVPVVCAASGDPVRLILDRLDRLRALGMGRRR